MAKSLHVCWLLDDWKASREQYLRAWVAAGWSVVLWHGGQLAATPVVGVELRLADNVVFDSPIERSFAYEERHKNHGGCADLFRYQILCELGGCYSDLDVLPGRNTTPSLFDTRAIPGFDRSWFPRVNPLTLAWSMEIRFIFTPAPQHPLLSTLRDTAVRNTESFIDAGGYTKNGIDNLLARTGPLMAKNTVQRYALEQHVHLNTFLLPDVIQSTTLENCKEHYTDKQPEIRRVAGIL